MEVAAAASSAVGKVNLLYAPTVHWIGRRRRSSGPLGGCCELPAVAMMAASDPIASSQAISNFPVCQYKENGERQQARRGPRANLGLSGFACSLRSARLGPLVPSLESLSSSLRWPAWSQSPSACLDCEGSQVSGRGASNVVVSALHHHMRRKTKSERLHPAHSSFESRVHTLPAGPVPISVARVVRSLACSLAYFPTLSSYSSPGKLQLRLAILA